MKSKLPPAVSIAIIGGVVAVAFFLGKSRASREANESEFQPAPLIRHRPVSATADPAAASETIADRMPKQLHGLSVDQARRLTSEQRLAHIADASLVFTASNQVEMLSGLIGALSKEEMLQATDLLGSAQDRGNLQPQEIWIELWTQWGRVDPLGGLQHFVDRPGGKGPGDARSIMHGWLEIDPDAAIRWAHEPKSTVLNAAAAALAISDEADGDLRKMEVAMLGLPETGPARAECADRYFDMAELAADRLDPAASYDALPETLRAAAWPTAFTRISRGDDRMTMAWVKAHYGDSGRDNEAMRGFIQRRAEADPVGTLVWTRSLPEQDFGNSSPTVIALWNWMDRDPPKAVKWMLDQPVDASWLKPFQRFMDDARNE